MRQKERYKLMVFESPLSKEITETVKSFLAKYDHVSFFAHPEWDDIIRQHTKQTVFRIILRYDEDIIATLALTYIPAHIFGKKLIATGFFTGNNFIHDHDTHGMHMIMEHIHMLGRNLNVDYIEFKDIDLSEIAHIQTDTEKYASFTSKLPDFSTGQDEESLRQNILQGIPRKKRADIRKALNTPELTFVRDVSFEDFYSIYSTTQRDLGTPIHKKSFYKAIYNLPYSHVTGVSHNGKIIAVCLSLEDTQHILAYYGGALPEGRKLHAYDYMYYNLICDAAIRGVKIFDFGRSKCHSGAYDYKKHWGFEPASVTHSYDLLLQDHLPNVTPNNPAYQRKIRFWQALPLWITNFLGPFIIKHIG